MNSHQTDSLVKEYTSLLDETGDNTDVLLKRLETDSEWSADAAEHLVKLVTDYGSFMLRNALALAIALKHEDGNLGF